MNAVMQGGTAFQTDRFVPIDVERFDTSMNETRVLPFRVPWRRGLQDRLNELASLPDGWDGYNGVAVNPQCAAFAADVLARLERSDVPAPSLVPGSSGGLQIEWHRNGYDVELEIRGVHEISALRVTLADAAEQVLELQDDLSAIEPWIAALAAPPDIDDHF